MMWIAGAAIAVTGTLIASYIDIKTKEIPNEITLGMIIVGAAFCAVRIYYGMAWLIIILPLAFAILLIWLMWRAGLFGGGDAKLLMGIVILVPTFSDGVSLIPTFFLMIAIISAIHYFVFGVTETMRRRELKSAIFILLPIIIGVAVYLATERISSFAPIFAIFSFAVAADLISPFMPYKRKVPVSDELEGEMLAETVGLKDGKVARVAETPSMLMKIFSTRRQMDEVIAAPHYLGISREEIKKLGELCTHVYIFPTYPMAPMILTALILTLLVGNIMPL